MGFKSDAEETAHWWVMRGSERWEVLEGPDCGWGRGRGRKEGAGTELVTQLTLRYETPTVSKR